VGAWGRHRGSGYMRVARRNIRDLMFLATGRGGKAVVAVVAVALQSMEQNRNYSVMSCGKLIRVGGRLRGEQETGKQATVVGRDVGV